MKHMITILCLLMVHNVFAAVYFKNKMTPDPQSLSDVNITVMRWGVLDRETDRIVGQTASDRYSSVTLVFESMISTQTIRKLTISTAVNACSDQRDERISSRAGRGRNSRGGVSNGRDFVCAACGKANAKSAMMTDGCMFEITFPHDPASRRMRLVDVMAEGKSLKYFCKFNISPDLATTTSKVAVPLGVTLHTPMFTFEDVQRTSGAPVDDPAMDSPDFQIISAVFGAGNKTVNVTEKLKTFVNNGVLNFGTRGRYGTLLECGDPAPNVIKTLRITYKRNGKTLTESFEEGATITLPAVSQ